MRWSLAVLVVGCYSPTYRAGSACETVCPGNLECIDRVCREPGYVADASDPVVDTGIAIDALSTDAPPVDTDGDSRFDHEDNCPAKANADQHDEDEDDIGDACDPCPHLAGTATDGDGDGVGDACDPQPALAKQSIKFFDPFTSDKAEWVHAGSVARMGETLRMSGTSAFTRLVVGTGELRIATGGTVASVSASTPHQLSLAFGFNSAGDDYYYGEFYDGSGNGGAVGIRKADSGTYTDLDQDTYAGALPTGAFAMRIDQSVTAQTVGMTATLGGIAYGPLAAATSSPSLITSSAMSMFTQNVDYRFDYFLVIETVP